MDVIEKLDRMRLERDMSVYRLAELSGINQSTLANTFSRGTVPSLKNLEAICTTLGVTLSQFFAEEEESVLLTPEERRLMENYRRLPEPLKRSVADIINSVPDFRN